MEQVTSQTIFNLVAAYDVPEDARDRDAIAATLAPIMVDAMDAGAVILGVCVFTATMLKAHGFHVPHGADGFVGLRIVSGTGDGDVPAEVEHSIPVATMRIIVAVMNDDQATAMALVGAQIALGMERCAELVIFALENYHRLHWSACQEGAHE